MLESLDFLENVPNVPNLDFSRLHHLRGLFIHNTKARNSALLNLNYKDIDKISITVEYKIFIKIMKNILTLLPINGVSTVITKTTKYQDIFSLRKESLFGVNQNIDTVRAFFGEKSESLSKLIQFMRSHLRDKLNSETMNKLIDEVNSGIDNKKNINGSFKSKLKNDYETVLMALFVLGNLDINMKTNFGSSLPQQTIQIGGDKKILSKYTKKNSKHKLFRRKTNIRKNQKGGNFDSLFRLITTNMDLDSFLFHRKEQNNLDFNDRYFVTQMNNILTNIGLVMNHLSDRLNEYIFENPETFICECPPTTMGELRLRYEGFYDDSSGGGGGGAGRPKRGRVEAVQPVQVAQEAVVVPLHDANSQLELAALDGPITLEKLHSQLRSQHMRFAQTLHNQREQFTRGPAETAKTRKRQGKQKGGYRAILPIYDQSSIETLRINSLRRFMIHPQFHSIDPKSHTLQHPTFEIEPKDIILYLMSTQCAKIVYKELDDLGLYNGVISQYSIALLAYQLGLTETESNTSNYLNLSIREYLDWFQYTYIANTVNDLRLINILSEIYGNFPMQGDTREIQIEKRRKLLILIEEYNRVQNQLLIDIHQEIDQLLEDFDKHYSNLNFLFIQGQLGGSNNENNNENNLLQNSAQLKRYLNDEDQVNVVLQSDIFKEMNEKLRKLRRSGHKLRLLLTRTETEFHEQILRILEEQKRILEEKKELLLLEIEEDDSQIQELYEKLKLVNIKIAQVKKMSLFTDAGEAELVEAGSGEAVEDRMETEQVQTHKLELAKLARQIFDIRYKLVDLFVSKNKLTESVQFIDFETWCTLKIISEISNDPNTINGNLMTSLGVNFDEICARNPSSSAELLQFGDGSPLTLNQSNMPGAGEAENDANVISLMQSEQARGFLKELNLNLPEDPFLPELISILSKSDPMLVFLTIDEIIAFVNDKFPNDKEKDVKFGLFRDILNNLPKYNKSTTPIREQLENDYRPTE